MVNIDKQVAFWRQGSVEDWDVARALVERGNVRHGLFFAHLALEKILKALVCTHTQEIAPRLHNLLRLVELAGVQLSSDSLDVLAEMNVFSLEGRYPDALSTPPTVEEAQRVLARTAEVLECLNRA